MKFGRNIIGIKAPGNRPGDQRSIQQRMARQFIVSLIGFVVLGLTYAGALVLTETAADTASRVTKFRFMVADIERGMLQARRHEKDFLARRDDKYVQSYEKELETIYRQLDAAEAIAPDDSMRKPLAELRQDFQSYQTLFRGAVENQKIVGYDEKSGRHGALRTAVHDAEELLNKHNKIEMTASMLMMRRHEKDFIQRRDPKYIEQMSEEQQNFDKLLARSGLSLDVKSEISNAMDSYHKDFLQMADAYGKLGKATDLAREAARNTEPVLVSFKEKAEQLLTANTEATARFTRWIAVGFAGVLLLIGVLSSRQMFSTSRAVTAPLRVLTDTITAITGGDKEARAKLTTGDEMQQLGDALDTMVSEREAVADAIMKKNDALNDSIIEILRSMSKLAQGDLRVQAPVREDVTGALSDAINSMSESTAKTLANVTNVSNEVRSASQEGRDTVQRTSKGMNDIRGTIQETGKRIKRLGERSQEITGMVKLIDDIAERTSVLALNANMQAAMAGEAGRGFRVVADEVQRLAERSKEATDQIGKLVSTIQAETNDTMITMDRAIGEVVKGGEMADKAAAQVTRLDELGGTLLESVRAFTLPEGLVQTPTVRDNRKAA